MAIQPAWRWGVVVGGRQVRDDLVGREDGQEEGISCPKSPVPLHRQIRNLKLCNVLRFSSASGFLWVPVTSLVGTLVRHISELQTTLDFGNYVVEFDITLNRFCCSKNEWGYQLQQGG